MIVNADEYVFAYYAIDTNTFETKFGVVADSLEQLNEVISNTQLEMNCDCICLLQVCRMSQGQRIIEFDQFCSKFEPFSPEEIKDIIDDITEEQLDCEAEEDEWDDYYQDDTGEYLLPYKQELSTFKYVCPKCLNTLEQCTCKREPDELERINATFHDILMEFKQKGYEILAYNESHPEYGKYDHIEIQFAQHYKFDVYKPREGYYKYGDLYYPQDWCEKDIEKRVLFKQKKLNELYEWAKKIKPIE